MEQIPMLFIIQMIFQVIPFTIFALFNFLIDGLNGGNILGLYYWIIIITMIFILLCVKGLTKNTATRDKLNLSFWFAQIMLRVSYVIAHIYGYKGGFPIKAMIYPSCGACGGDAPPFDTLPLLFTNIAIWWLISYGLLLLVPSHIKQKSWFKRLVYILGIVLTIYGFGGLMLIFD